ncbi:MAG: DUF2344 domain-containing protein [Lachnospiraceae bacterium]|nr:DUF2344 domain-containing protein [Lachnospiraceae bacterium]
MRDKIRVKFEKTGMMKFIGHLDVMRYFQKAIRRANIDIAYSEGFSPHQKMSFAAPLGIGLVGMGEYFDIEVYSIQGSSEDMKNALNNTMVDGFKVVSLRKLPENVPNAMSSVYAADYTVTIHGDNIKLSPKELSEKIIAFYNQDTIITEKETKKSTRMLDIKPLIYSLTSVDGVTKMCLSTGSTDNIKPELVMQKFCETYLGIEYTEDPILFDYQRDEVYTNVAKEGEAMKLVTLEDMGEVIEG